MERKDFIRKAGCACLFGPALINAESSVSAPVHQPGTPCEKKFEFSQTYVKRLMELLPRHLGEGGSIAFVRDMGATCARGAYGDKETATGKLPIGDFMQQLNARKEGNDYYWQYTRNPDGLKISDGYCLCPLTEKGPEGLSGLYCECSVGYVTYMIERYTGSQVKVELLESLKRGGKACRFKITPVS